LPDVIQIQRQHQRLAPHTSGSEAGLNARVARTDDNHIIDFFAHVSRETSNS
jgi:hypothetical protein